MQSNFTNIKLPRNAFEDAAYVMLEDRHGVRNFFEMDELAGENWQLCVPLQSGAYRCRFYTRKGDDLSTIAESKLRVPSVMTLFSDDGSTKLAFAGVGS